MILIGQDRLAVEEKYIAVYFTGKRKVLSTSPQNGGIHTELKGVFNLDGKPEEGEEIILEGGTYESHLRYVSRNILGISDDASTGMMTAAQMHHAGYAQRQYGELTVTAIVTGGIDKNGGRVGDPAFWKEEDGIWTRIEADTEKNKRADKANADISAKMPDMGTINIMLFIDGNLSDTAISRAVVTCTEAKTAAIQELSLPSQYSSGLATGSGTDGTIVVSNMDSPLHLMEAGKHCKLGELIGSAVKAAVKETLYRQTGAGPKRQKHAFRRLGRYGITPEKLWEYALKQNLTDSQNREIFLKQAEIWAAGPHTAAWAALEAHLLDEKTWGMLTEEEALDAQKCLWEGFFCRREKRKGRIEETELLRWIVEEIKG